MGSYNYSRYRPRKRKDYEITEIEKKYSEKDLSKLILLSNVQNYPKLKIFPGRICNTCKNNQVESKFQLSGILICEECNKKEKEKYFKEMLKVFAETKIKYEGSFIVDNKLIIGSIETSYLKDNLKSLGVTHILMLGYYMTPLYPNDFIYEQLEISDNTNENILQYLIKGIKYIDKSFICYCHCQYGNSRSASFAIAYIMYKNKIHFSEAYNLVKMKRKKICPNEGFQCQLEDFDIILSNFDYDLNKCDTFMKKYMNERDKLRKTEFKYLIEKIKEQKGKRKYSESDIDYGLVVEDKTIINKNGNEKESKQ